MTIGAAHLALAQRMMIGQTHLPAFGLVTFQAGIVRCPAGLRQRSRFRNQLLDIRYMGGCQNVNGRVLFRSCLVVGVGLMTVNAAHLVGSMRPGHPVANAGLFRMTAQADSVGISRGAVPEGDDLRHVSARSHMQAARSVALLTLHALLRMKSV